MLPTPEFVESTGIRCVSTQSCQAVLFRLLTPCTETSYWCHALSTRRLVLSTKVTNTPTPIMIMGYAPRKLGSAFWSRPASLANALPTLLAALSRTPVCRLVIVSAFCTAPKGARGGHKFGTYEGTAAHGGR